MLLILLSSGLASPGLAFRTVLPALYGFAHLNVQCSVSLIPSTCTSVAQVKHASTANTPAKLSFGSNVAATSHMHPRKTALKAIGSSAALRAEAKALVDHVKASSSSTTYTLSLYTQVKALAVHAKRVDTLIQSLTKLLAKQKATADKAKAELAGKHKLLKLKERPKRIPSAYNLYLKDHAAEFKKKANIATLAAKWTKLPASKRQHYIDQSNELRKVATEAAAPRLHRYSRHIRAYSFFVKEKFAVVKAEHPGLQTVEIAKKLAVKWQALGAQEKQKYKDMEAADKQAKAAATIAAAAK